MSTPNHLTNALHGLRHLVFVQKFNINSCEYVSSLYSVGCLPLLVVMILLFWLSVYKMYRIHVSWQFSKPCLCIFRCHINTCATVMIIALCCELILHHCVLRGLPVMKFHETDSIRQYRLDTSESVRATFVGLDAYNRTPNGATGAEFKEVIDLYRMYKRFALDIIAAGHDTYRPLIDEHRARHSSVKQTLLRYEWYRFLIFTTIWSVAVATLMLYVCDYCKVTEVCSLCGIVFCALVTSLLLTLAVLIADACHEPWHTLDNLRQSRPELHTAITEAQFSQYCNDTKLEAARRIKEFLKVFINGERQMMRSGYVEGARMRTWSAKIDKSWPWAERGPGARQKYVLSVMPLFYKWAYIESLDAKIQWRILTVNCENDLPRVSEDLTSVCANDHVLKWVVWQLVMVTIAVISLAMIMHSLADRTVCLPKYCKKESQKYALTPLPAWVPRVKRQPCAKSKSKTITFGQ